MVGISTPESEHAAKLERSSAFQIAHRNMQTAQMRGGNMLMAISGGGAQSGPQPMPAPAAAPPLLAQHAARAEQRPPMTPQQVDHHSDRIGFLVHLIAPLVRKPGPVTRRDVANLVSDAVASGKFSPSEGADFMAGIPNDPAKIKQALAEVLVHVVLTAIHLKGLPGTAADAPGRGMN